MPRKVFSARVERELEKGCIKLYVRLLSCRLQGFVMATVLMLERPEIIECSGMVRNLPSHCQRERLRQCRRVCSPKSSVGASEVYSRVYT